MTNHNDLNSKLIILVSLNGFSFYSTSVGATNAYVLKSISFSDSLRTEKMENLLGDVFNKNNELTLKYDEVVVLHHNNLATFVPTELFDEDFLASYLQYTTKVFETDFIAFDSLQQHQMNAVYIPYVNMNNFFIDYFGTFSYHHASTILVNAVLAIAPINEHKNMYVHVSDHNFEIIIVQNQKLLLYNSFDYNTPEDFIYYILFTAEQLQLDPNNFQLTLLGLINPSDSLYQICYKYIRNVAFLNNTNTSNKGTEIENRHHFILLNA